MEILTLQSPQPNAAEIMPSDYKTLNIWLVEDDKLYRNTVEQVINATEDLRVTADFHNCETLLKRHSFFSETDFPDVIILDINFSPKGKKEYMSGIDGIEEIKKKLSGTPIVMLTDNDESDFIFRAFQRGASGYLNKSATTNDILDAIRMAKRGGMIIPPAVAVKVMRLFQGVEVESEKALTKREMEIVELMAKGRSRKKIATELFISPNTVDSHLNKIYQKLHVSTGNEAIAKIYGSRSPLEG
ncbi:MAG: response regulator [Rhodothermales bacterium]